MTRKTLTIGALTTLALAMFAVNTVRAQDAFGNLSKAYTDRDAVAAGEAYAENATVVYAYDGVPEERIDGRRAIVTSFRSFFDGIDAAHALDLNFRVTGKNGGRLHGIYRLGIGTAEVSYGRFDVRLNDKGLFLFDRSTSATRADFEEAAGPPLLRPDDQELDRSYYGLLAGRYRLPDGCELVVTRSIVRLFARNTCDNSWRGLTRVSGLEWTAGHTVIPAAAAARYSFARVSDAPSAQVRIARAAEARAVRVAPYRVEDVHFSSADGTRLAGSLYLPKARAGRRAATVMLHGSGPQDRDGYASIIAVMADTLAAEGRVVLAYDKRGSGRSGGNGDAATFDTLAADAVAAVQFLRGREEVAADSVGLAGSSQAGWVAAKAIELGAEPADVFLLGAAGTAFTVREQNLYNTDARMTCAGIGSKDRRAALNQQSAFFDALADRTKVPRLDELTRDASARPPIREWIFPGSEGLDDEDAWFTVLAPDFDPLPVWRRYKGRTTLVFSEFDDSTDTRTAVERLRGLNARTVVLSDAQHLGLKTTSVCDGDLAQLDGFSPKLFAELATFARSGGVDVR